VQRRESAAEPSPPASAEFDAHAQEYRALINRYASASGESLEFYIEQRISLLRERCEEAGAGPPERILDFGCGIGLTEVFLHKHFPDAEILGVDVSADSLRVAEGRGLPGVRFLIAQGDALPVEPASCDLVYSNGTFHHIARPEHGATMRALRRAVRPGGHAFVFENNPFNPVMLHAMHRSPLDRNAHTLRPGYLERLVQGAGFRAEPAEFYAFFPAALRGLRRFEPRLRRVPLGAQYFVWGRAA